VRFQVRLPDRNLVFVELNPDDDVTSHKPQTKRFGKLPGSLTCTRWEENRPGGGEARNKRVDLRLTQPQVDLLMSILDRMFPEGLDTEVEDFSEFDLFGANCVTTLAGVYLEVIDGGGPLLPGQKRLRWIFDVADTPATLWPRLRSTVRRMS
jgi:hypothetical protein